VTDYFTRHKTNADILLAVTLCHYFRSLLCDNIAVLDEFVKSATVNWL